MRSLRDASCVGAIAVTLTGCAAQSRPATEPAIAQDQLAVTLPNACPSPPDAEGTPAPCGELGAFDRFFNDAYQAAQDYTKQHHGPVVLVSGSNLILVLEGRPPVSARVIPDAYHALKAVAHFPFAVYLSVEADAGQQLSPATRSTLERFVGRMPEARADLARFTLSSEQVARQQRILDTTAEFVRALVADGSVSRERLNTFAGSVGPLLAQNTRDAGCAQVLSTHRQMRAWKAAEPAVDWSSLVVINRGSHQARYRNAATQYFAWLLGGTAPAWSYPGESLHVVYAENITPPAGMTNASGTDLSMEMFSTIELDAAAGRAFFGNPWRMSEDVLSDGAAQCIAHLPAGERWAE